MHINLVCIDNAAGLSRDAKCLMDSLEGAGHHVTWMKRTVPPNAWFRIRRTRLQGLLLPRIDVNIFIERIWPEWLPFARRNVLLANPEWTLPGDLQLLPTLDCVLCKSKAAVPMFAAIAARSEWVGFTSADLFNGHLAASTHKVETLHVAGRSPHKGTEAVVSTWLRHPEWPQLTVVRRPLIDGDVLHTTAAPNIRYLTHRVPDDQLVALQRHCAIHIAPSTAEGYGHSIAEGMGVGAVVITTDAPPMNEIVQPGRGMLVKAKRGDAIGLTNHYHVNPEALDAAISSVFDWPHQRRVATGTAARQWFVDNERRFLDSLPRVVERASRR